MTTPAPARTPSRPAPKLTGGATPQGQEVPSERRTHRGRQAHCRSRPAVIGQDDAVLAHPEGALHRQGQRGLAGPRRFPRRWSRHLRRRDRGVADARVVGRDRHHRARSATAFQQLATLKVVGTPKPGETPKSIESFGFGKGYRHLFETMLLLLAALDRHIEQGRNVVLVCHSIVGNCPEPDGRGLFAAPALAPPEQSGPAPHLRPRVGRSTFLFVNRDVTVKDGKGETKGTRAIQTVWSPCGSPRRARSA
jgi:hypothetical protein